MANLSQQKRQRMLEFLQTIREEHKDDDDVLIALGEIESELNAKKYSLVWEQHEEAVDLQMRDNIPVLKSRRHRQKRYLTVRFILPGSCRRHNSSVMRNMRSTVWIWWTG